MSKLNVFTTLGPGQMRLLCIAPDEFTAPLICSTSTLPLAEPPQYETLSYAWGPPGVSSSSISLNDETFKISVELEAALRWLRLPDTMRYVWIDAICIDQSNIVELNSQVSKMTEIYRSAWRAVVWLGEATSDSDRALAFLREMSYCSDRRERSRSPSENSDDSDQPTRQPETLTKDELIERQLDYWKSTLDFYAASLSVKNRAAIWKEIERSVREGAGHVVTREPCLYYMDDGKYRDFFESNREEDWEALDNLLARPWWSRTWIVQEVWTSSNCIIQCGGSTLKWSTFRAAMDYQEGWDDMGYMIKRTARWSKWALLKRRYGLAIHLANERLLGSDLSDVLWNMWDREATDPRDKVFAIRGLLQESSRNSVPSADYSKSMQQVYCEVAAHIVHHEKKLDILLAGNGLERQSNLPSWVPDWRREANDDRPQLFINGSRMQIMSYFAGSTRYTEVRGHGFYASGDSPFWAEISDDLTTLRVRSFVLGIVDTVAPVCASDASTQNILIAARSILPSAEELENQRKAGPVSDRELLGSLHAAIMGNPGGSGSDGIQEAVQLQQGENAGLSEDELASVLRAAFPVYQSTFDSVPGRGEDETIRNIMDKRRFFVTTDGHLCVGPAITQPGDRIHIIAGCNFPIVLRPDGESEGLVGEAYGKIILP